MLLFGYIQFDLWSHFQIEGYIYLPIGTPMLPTVLPDALCSFKEIERFCIYFKFAYKY